MSDATRAGLAWTCHARPLSKHGKVCGYFNELGGSHDVVQGTEHCRHCGCTRKASDDRKEKADARRSHDTR